MLKTIAAAATLLLGTAVAQAQDWPTRPVTMVVPYAAGGPVDTIGRILGARLGEILGQQIIVENVGGAGGMTGSARVVKAAPDGYTFLLAGSAVMAQVQTLYKKPLYNSVADFTPVALLTDSARILLTRKDFPAKTFAEFVTHAKANQAKLQYGSAGVGSGSHVCALLLDQAMGVKITHIPYRGAGPAMQDLIGGRLDYMCEQISTAVPQVQGGKVKALALLGPERVAVLPDLPAMRENGFPELDCGAWSAFVVPKGTPDAIVRRFARAASETVDSAAVRERLAKVGVTIVPAERRSPEYLAKYIPAEIARWAAPIKASGVVSD
jgi:tripartite-type tricarboxylate transporter receptor subunit TctC